MDPELNKNDGRARFFDPDALDGRKQRILTAIVDAYIKNGGPVGSKALLDSDESFNLSSATIRNEMSELERMGLLCKPHTSAGRIPSNAGLLLYAQLTRGGYSLSLEERRSLLVGDGENIHSAVRRCAEMLARFTGCSAFVLSPVGGGGILSFEVCPVGRRTLAVMGIGANGAVRSAFFKTSEPPSAEDISALGNVLNSVMVGFSLDGVGEIRYILLENSIKKACPSMIGAAAAVRELVESIRSYDLFVGGASNLLSYPEFADLEAAKEYMEMISSREDLSDFLLDSAEDGAFSVRVGEKKLNGRLDMGVVSLSCKGKLPVVISVIGPARMDYPKVIAGMTFMAEGLEKLIEDEY